jgi:hypothetical protein
MCGPVEDMGLVEELGPVEELAENSVVGAHGSSIQYHCRVYLIYTPCPRYGDNIPNFGPVT